MNIRKVCKHCGSTGVRVDAWAIWDEDAQEWVLDNVFDYEYCVACEGDTTIKDVDVPYEVTKEDNV